MTLEVLATVHNSGGKTTTVYVTIAKQMLSFMENLMDLANVVLKVPRINNDIFLVIDYVHFLKTLELTG